MSTDSGFLNRLLSPQTLVTLVSMLVGFGVIYGALITRIGQNEAAITQLSAAVVANRQFGINHRVRLWDRVDKIEDQQTRLFERLAGIEAISRQTNSMVEKLLELQLKQAGGGR